ncbi:MAG: hypothetical protein ACI3XY_01120 [Butyricicoccaceae bacterium]
MITYHQTLWVDEQGRIWYGIAAVRGEEIVAKADSLTMDQELIHGLLEKMNRAAIAEYQFYDIIEDFLAQ